MVIEPKQGMWIRAHRTGSDSMLFQSKQNCHEIYGDFRILIERLVETVFLAVVGQRHRRAVNTKGKIENPLKINADDCALVDEMISKYSCYEHSQSAEVPVDVPEPDDLACDIDRMTTWHAEFSERSACGVFLDNIRDLHSCRERDRNGKGGA